MLRIMDRILVALLIPVGIGFIIVILWKNTRTLPIWLLVVVTLYLFFFSIYVFIRNKQSGPSILKLSRRVRIEGEQQEDKREKPDEEQ